MLRTTDARTNPRRSRSSWPPQFLPTSHPCRAFVSAHCLSHTLATTPLTLTVPRPCREDGLGRRVPKGAARPLHRARCTAPAAPVRGPPRLLYTSPPQRSAGSCCSPCVGVRRICVIARLPYRSRGQVHRTRNASLASRRFIAIAKSSPGSATYADSSHTGSERKKRSNEAWQMAFWTSSSGC